jgi:hypothetical protein
MEVAIDTLMEAAAKDGEETIMALAAETPYMPQGITPMRGRGKVHFF